MPVDFSSMKHTLGKMTIILPGPQLPKKVLSEIQGIFPCLGKSNKGEMYVFCPTCERDFSCACGSGMTADDTFYPNHTWISKSWSNTKAFVFVLCNCKNLQITSSDKSRGNYVLTDNNIESIAIKRWPFLKLSQSISNLSFLISK